LNFELNLQYNLTEVDHSNSIVHLGHIRAEDIHVSGGAPCLWRWTISLLVDHISIGGPYLYWWTISLLVDHMDHVSEVSQQMVGVKRCTAPC